MVWVNRTVESNDPDEFVSLIRPADRKLLVTERGQFEARGTLIDVGRLQAQRRYERLSRIMYVEISRPGIIFLTEPGPEMFLNGAAIRYEDIALFNSSETYLWRLSGPTNWGAITLANDDIKAVCPSYQNLRSIQMSAFAVITPPPRVLARLRTLHAFAGDLPMTSGGMTHQIELEQGVEQALTTAMLKTIDAEDVRSDTAARQHYHMISRRFVEMLETQALEPLHIPTISDAIGVSSRTLRLACQQQFGISPLQYVMLGRMRSARRALLEADPETTRVTDIATEFCFWELGRFAVNYRHIFGESPSATLRRTT